MFIFSQPLDMQPSDIELVGMPIVIEPLPRTIEPYTDTDTIDMRYLLYNHITIAAVTLARLYILTRYTISREGLVHHRITTNTTI